MDKDPLVRQYNTHQLSGGGLSFSEFGNVAEIGYFPDG
jgi:hypothetical protein